MSTRVDAARRKLCLFFFFKKILALFLLQEQHVAPLSFRLEQTEIEVFEQSSLVFQTKVII